MHSQNNINKIEDILTQIDDVSEESFDRQINTNYETYS